MGGAQRPIYVSVATAKTVVATVQAEEIKLKCGAPTAPPPGMCVPKPLHDQIQGYILEAAEYGQQVSLIMASLPDGSPTPGQVIDLVAKISELLRKVMASLPKSPQADALQAQLAGK